MCSLRSLVVPLATLAIALPWLNPFAPGPYPPALQWVVSLACTAVIAAWLAWCRPSRDQVAQVAVDGWLVAAVVSSFVGIFQYLGWADSFSPWMNSSVPGQAYANLRQRNQFATLCAIGLACVLWGRFSLVRLPPWGTLALAALLGLGSAASSSRTGLVQMLVLGAGVALWSGKQRPWSALGAACVGFAVGLFVLPQFLGLDPFAHGLLSRLGGDASPCNSRVALWNNVLHLISLKPWTGWGWGELGFAHYMVLQPELRFCDILDNAHNLFLQLAVEVGVPVTALLGLALLALFTQGRVRTEQRPTVRVAWAVVVVILLHSMLEYPLWYGPFLIAMALALVTVWPWAASPRPGRTATTPAAPNRSVAWAGIAALLVAGAAYMAWEYQRVSQIFLPQDERSPAYRTDTLNKLRDARMFKRYVQYAELTTTPVSAQSAERVRELALAVLHFSAEPRVIEKLLDSTLLLGDNDALLDHMARYEAAFPREYKRWRSGQPESE